MIAVAATVAVVVLVAIAPPFLRALRCYTDWAAGEVAAGEVVKADAEVKTNKNDAAANIPLTGVRWLPGSSAL